MLEAITNINSSINNIVWGIPALVLLVGTGVLLTIITKGFQFVRFGHAMKETIGSLFSNKGRIHENK